MSTDLSLFFFSSNCKTLVHWLDCTELNLHQDPHKLQQNLRAQSSLHALCLAIMWQLCNGLEIGNCDFLYQPLLKHFIKHRPLSTVHCPLVPFSFRVWGLSKNPECPKRLFGKGRTLIQNWEDPKLEAKRPKPERPTLNSPAEMSKMVKFLRNLNVIIWLMGNWIANGNWTYLKSVEWLDFWLFGQLVGMVPLVSWLVILVWCGGWMVLCGWFADWFVWWLNCWLAGWLVGVVVGL